MTKGDEMVDDPRIGGDVLYLIRSVRETTYSLLCFFCVLCVYQISSYVCYLSGNCRFRYAKYENVNNVVCVIGIGVAPSESC